MVELESILDAPREELDSLVWTKTKDGKYTLTDYAKSTIEFIVQYVKNQFHVDDMSVRITGSITSNQYSENSDIDLHFSYRGLTEENSEDMNKVLRADFNENFKTKYAGKEMIGDHPVEVYFQANPYQDMMSIGCYDFIADVWMVGPDMKPLDFDPYSEFYDEDMEYVRDIVKDIRINMLDCYETATVILNSTEEDFRKEQFEDLKTKLGQCVEVFKSAKQCRKLYSSPVSVEDALEKRESRKWKIADSAFKLLDKFGYLKILKKFSDILDVASQDKEADIDIISDAVLKSVTATMNLNETIEESISGMTKFLILASYLAIPGLMSQDALAQSLSRIPKTELKLYSEPVQASIQKVCKDKSTYGGYASTDIVNMVARTLYAEGRSEGTEGRKAILSVIVNRAGNDRNNIAAVIKEKYAFSCWNKMTDSDWKKYVYKIPSSGSLSIVGNQKNLQVWNECVGLAIQAFDGRFKSTIGTRNSYLNPDTADKGALDSWGKSMDLKIGKHKFGYLKEHDPKFVIAGTMTPKAKSAEKKTEAKTYIVKKGDNLEKIAKMHKTTVSDILSKNKQIKNPDKIFVGQKITI